MMLRTAQAGQRASSSARIPAMLEYHSCSHCPHLQGQRPSSSNMPFLRAEGNGGRIDRSRCGAKLRVHAIHNACNHVSGLGVTSFAVQPIGETGWYIYGLVPRLSGVVQGIVATFRIFYSDVPYMTTNVMLYIGGRKTWDCCKLPHLCGDPCGSAARPATRAWARKGLPAARVDRCCSAPIVHSFPQ